MAAPKIERLGEDTRIVVGPTNLGLVGKPDGPLVLVDSGNDDDAGRKILRAVESEGGRIAMIALTHSNADHCGGNAFIQARTGCRIAATRVEAAFTETPLLEPAYLWGGFPPPVLRSKFLMAQSSRVTDILEPPCILPDTAPGIPRIEAVPLPGHFFGQAGFLTRDRVFFAADAVASVEILEKYHIFYLCDIESHLATLDRLEQLDADWFVPSHALPTRDIRPVVKANRDKLWEIVGVILRLCEEPQSSEILLAKLADHYGIVLNSSQHVLIGSTLRSFLAWLIGKKEITSTIESNIQLFRRIQPLC